MLEIQKYLNSGKTLQNLELDFAISSTHHKDLPIVILNYSQIDSPKTHPITIESRQLILEKETWDVVSQSFFRFFNIGEALEITDKFDWTNYRVFEKCDGSIVSLFNYKGEWLMATRSSFGFGKMEEVNFTWADLFWSLISRERIQNVLNSSHTYVFEMCSLHNQVVTVFPEPKLYLLDIVPRNTMFIRGTIDDHIQSCDYLADYLRVGRPKIYQINTNNPQDIKNFVNSMSNQEEGLVLQDVSGMRVKCKNQKWLILSKTKNNGALTKERILDIILSGESQEFLTYFPAYKRKIGSIANNLESLKTQVNSTYEKYKRIESQKDFALKVKDFKYSNILFMMRRNKLSYEECISKNSKILISLV